MSTDQVALHSQAPAIVVAAVLDLAKTAVYEQLTEGSDEQHRRAKVELDLETYECKVRSDASPIVYRGMFVRALTVLSKREILNALRELSAARSKGKPSILKASR